jgi:hypothetical protein
MINTLFLALLGATLGVRRRVFVLIPAGFMVSLIALAFWLAAGELNWIKLVIGLAYLSTLSLGYIVGGLLVVRKKTGNSVSDPGEILA